jgi:hypothetical protein
MLGRPCDSLFKHLLSRKVENKELVIEADQHLTVQAARKHSRFKGESLIVMSNGKFELADDIIEALSKRRGQLVMNFLSAISDKSAEHLSRHVGDLSLDGLASLSDRAAEYLSLHLGGISLMGLTELSENGARSLAGSQYYIQVKSLQLPMPARSILHQKFMEHPAIAAEYRPVPIEDTLAAIELAFDGIPLGNGISLAEADAIDNYCTDEERIAARSRDERTDWRLITDSAIDAFPWAHIFMDDAGLLFHLPAWMSFTLRRYMHEESFAVDASIRVIEKISIRQLTEPQQEAIRLFLVKCHEIGDYWISLPETIKIN